MAGKGNHAQSRREADAQLRWTEQPGHASDERRAMRGHPMLPCSSSARTNHASSRRARQLLLAFTFTFASLLISSLPHTTCKGKLQYPLQPAQ
jgi:hypothetical protein